MKSRGTIEIRVSGYKGNLQLSPDHYDIKEIAQLFDIVESILFSCNKKQRPEITYSIENGSVRHIFKTSFQTIVATSAVLASVLQTGSIDKLDLPTARAIERLQMDAVSKDFEFSISTSEWKDGELRITPQTHYRRSEEIWVDAEVYYYGTLTDAGGKGKSNIHLDTKDGLIKIDVDKEYLFSYQGNPLYRKFGVIATAKQNIMTGAIDSSSLKLKELVEFEPKFDMDYLKEKIAASTPVWSGMNVDEYLHEIRGGLA